MPPYTDIVYIFHLVLETNSAMSLNGFASDYGDSPPTITSNVADSPPHLTEDELRQERLLAAIDDELFTLTPPTTDRLVRVPRVPMQPDLRSIRFIRALDFITAASLEWDACATVIIISLEPDIPIIVPRTPFMFNVLLLWTRIPSSSVMHAHTPFAIHFHVSEGSHTRVEHRLAALAFQLTQKRMNHHYHATGKLSSDCFGKFVVTENTDTYTMGTILVRECFASVFVDVLNECRTSNASSRSFAEDHCVTIDPSGTWFAPDQAVVDQNIARTMVLARFVVS
ncbi:hypothetical protein CONPUDRAFT_156397 [Coniophora puteana RWD-64-598 SS2]|uniref:Uncharacterized protein n=1 Tax=Coniophora puteana (strain RWD-64-598) TaxID=741705 RepID=A0A5M3MH72_CONPW|nr:uncharacterized protein CONPUDRAFT_156397 [Coniophora puteana RWD-64-598 SS2]EIW78407.1 hypothetical protein CONPUDRAFT_156397 [Coniophora puteana RWD-64-598 SS2]